MKLSLSWIFDHIDADWKKVDVKKLVSDFNQKVAEIESFYQFHIDLEHLAVAQITEQDEESVTVRCPEWNISTQLSRRKEVFQGDWVFIKRTDSHYEWALDTHFGGYKDIILPAFYMPDFMQDGEWKATTETHDIILEIDNKSITHRPDMWGHRGYAREIAALLDVPFKELSSVLPDVSVLQHAHRQSSGPSMPFDLAIETPACLRFAALYIKEVVTQPSLLWMAQRLIRTENKPIDAIVDTTNYVMLDLGQPLHAFDANTLKGNSVSVRMAHAKEKLTVIDGQELTLTTDDVVIADASHAVSLAGVMGGATTSITRKTTSVLLEAACFDATTIRKTAARHKKRTEGSARQEKSIDPAQEVILLRRALQLLKEAGIVVSEARNVIALGTLPSPKVIFVSHRFIEQRLGVALETDQVIKILEKISFGVQLTQDEDGNLCYEITVPSFRATKDITIPEDIVEEVGRFFGYDRITPELPSIITRPSSLTQLQRLRAIKTMLSTGYAFRELYSYAFYDETLLEALKWQPHHAVTIQNPVSEHWRRLVTSLVPHLLKAVEQNATDHDQLHFFEWARVWQQQDATITEEKRLAGILFDKSQLDFYSAKQIVNAISGLIHLPLTWQKIDKPELPWLMPFQSAQLMHGTTIVGYAGMVDPTFVRPLFEGPTFVFELNGDYLMNYTPARKRFVPLSKYPEVTRDISMLVPIQKTAQSYIDLISGISPIITHVTLVDFFQKAEWHDKRSLTIRVILQDSHKTLTTQEVDTIMEKVIAAVQQEGATIR